MRSATSASRRRSNACSAGACVEGVPVDRASRTWERHGGAAAAPLWQLVVCYVYPTTRPKRPIVAEAESGSIERDWTARFGLSAATLVALQGLLRSLRGG